MKAGDISVTYGPATPEGTGILSLCPLSSVWPVHLLPWRWAACGFWGARLALLVRAACRRRLGEWAGGEGPSWGEGQLTKGWRCGLGSDSRWLLLNAVFIPQLLTSQSFFITITWC